MKFQTLGRKPTMPAMPVIGAKPQAFKSGLSNSAASKIRAKANRILGRIGRSVKPDPDSAAGAAT